MGCGYCGNQSRESLLSCLECEQSFCSSTDGSKNSHILAHIKESGHSKFETSGGHKIGCGLCKETNVYELGGYSETGFMNFRCRSGCVDNTLSEADLSLWKPLVAGDALQPWLLAPTSFTNPLMFFEAIPKLERLWKKDPNANLNEIQKFNNRKVALKFKRKPHMQPALVAGFNSAKEYLAFFSELIQKERLAALLDERRNIINVACCLWDPIYHAQGELQLQVSPKRIYCGLEVKLILATKDTEWSAIGTIISIQPGKLCRIRVSFDKDKKQTSFPTSITSGYQLKIDAWSEVTFERMNCALESLNADSGLAWLGDALFKGTVSFNPMQRASCLARTGSFYESLQRTGLPTASCAPQLSSTMPADFGHLNPSQREALAMAIRKSFSLIQGPPGTGKSVCAVELVKVLVQEGKVLVCAPSNVVTDDLAKKLAETACLDVVRVVARSREELSADLPVALHNLCANESAAYASAKVQLRNLEKYYHEDPEEIRRLTKICLQVENERLNRADVIVTTCIGAGDGRVVNRRFTTVIIDEATQTVEPACLVPAVLSTHRVVLVGDHKQLGPVVIDNQAQVLGLGRSMFERLVELNLPRVRLDVQYRMHPAISSFPSVAFYQGTLEDGVSAAKRTFTASFRPFDALSGPKAVFFWHIPAEEEWDSRGRSLINRIEARRVEALLKAIPNGTNIGVITFYDGQRSLLMAAVGDRSCEIASVDGFQGREKEVVILSTVRANKKGRIGFLDDFRRLNVAITRAKKAMVICGNVRTIRASGDATWSSFLNHLDEQDAIFEGIDIYNLKTVPLASAH